MVFKKEDVAFKCREMEFLGFDLWIFHFLWRFSLSQISAFCWISNLDFLSEDRIRRGMTQQNCPNWLKVSIDHTFMVKLFSVVFRPVTLSREGGTQIGGLCLTVRCLAPPFSSRKLSSESCRIIWRGGFMKGAPLENLKKIPIVRSASLIFIVLSISLLISNFSG